MSLSHTRFYTRATADIPTPIHNLLHSSSSEGERLYPENALISQHKEEVVKHVVQLEASAQSEAETKDKHKAFKKAIKESEATFLRGM